MMDNQTILTFRVPLTLTKIFCERTIPIVASFRCPECDCCQRSQSWARSRSRKISQPRNSRLREAWRIAPHSSSPGPGLNLTSSPFGNLLMSLQFNDENSSQYSFRISSKRSCSIEDWSSFGPSYPLFLYNFRRLVNAKLKASTHESYETKIRMHQNGITRARGECRIDEWA